jgi:hypothetical protein
MSTILISPISKRRHRVVCLLLERQPIWGKPGNPRLPDRITVLLHVAVGVPGNNEAIGDLWFSPLKRRNFRSQKNKKRRKQGGAP